MFDKADFYKAFGEYVGVPEDVTITSVTDELYTDGYCETCYYETTKARVVGTYSDGSYYKESFWSTMSDFINSLS